MLKSLSPVSDNVTDRYYPSSRGYDCSRDDRNHKTVEEETVDGLKTLQAFGVSQSILGQCPNSISKYV